MELKKFYLAPGKTVNPERFASTPKGDVYRFTFAGTGEGTGDLPEESPVNVEVTTTTLETAAKIGTGEGNTFQDFCDVVVENEFLGIKKKNLAGEISGTTAEDIIDLLGIEDEDQIEAWYKDTFLRYLELWDATDTLVNFLYDASTGQFLMTE